MGSFYRPTWVEVSLDAIAHNVGEFRRALPAGKHVMAVVKANGYGHGAVEVSREALRAGAAYLAVAFLDEAIQLRQSGIDAPVLVMGYTPPEAVETARRYRITLAVYSNDVLEALEQSGRAAEAGAEPLRVHVKIDTGMSRIGLVGEAGAAAYIDRLLAVPGVQVEGLFTHYACADETDKTATRLQYEQFARLLAHYSERGIHFRYAHAGNSAAGIDTPELVGNMLRLGISLYGFYPSAHVDHTRIALRPAMSYKTRIVMLKTVPPDTGVSYGMIYRTSGEETIATVPVGYGDGYTRMLTGKASALVRGRRVPVVGRICMDQTMLDVSGVPDVRQGDEVVLFGSQQQTTLHADELAEALGTIHYEIACLVSCRVPRVYVRDDGTVERIVNPLIT